MADRTVAEARHQRGQPTRRTRPRPRRHKRARRVCPATATPPRMIVVNAGRQIFNQ
ncbi:hypothetical protein [Asanoa iriomotensis]|uniref:hypothetical protein n=1 Tax=Asanoa iriomotensis TaxID=234613 RepID=UPI001940690D|nr:hypothetical protein [Asanoa iriomotensis]